MFDNLISSREERELWRKRQKSGKLRFVLPQTISSAGLLLVILTYSPGVIFNWHIGTRAVGALACLSVLFGYLLSEALWRRGLTVTNEADAS